MRKVLQVHNNTYCFTSNITLQNFCRHLRENIFCPYPNYLISEYCVVHNIKPFVRRIGNINNIDKIGKYFIQIKEWQHKKCLIYEVIFPFTREGKSYNG